VILEMMNRVSVTIFPILAHTPGKVTLTLFILLSACIGVHPVPMSVFQVCHVPSIMRTW